MHLISYLSNVNSGQISYQDLVEINRKKDLQIESLKFELAQLKKAIYGSKSERFTQVDPEQANLFEAAGEEESGEVPQEDEGVLTVKKKRQGKQPVRNKIPESLRREEVIVEPEVDTAQMKKIGAQVSEKLEIKPAEIYVVKTVRPKYVDDDGKFHIADLNDPFPKSNAGASFAADIPVKKYVDHIPLYRQEKILTRSNLQISRSTLLNHLVLGYKKIEVLHQVLEKTLLKSRYIQADESSMPVLTKDRPGSTLKGCMLVKVAPLERLVVFDYIKTKEKINILESLKGFKGHLQVDGNVTYEEKGKEGGVTLMHCLVHSRRKFSEAKEYDDARSSYVLEEVQKVYMTERDLKEKELDHDQITKQRQEQVLPILSALHSWLLKELQPNLPNNPFQKAVKYMLKRWDGLIEFTNDGSLLPDNNLIENQIRPLALGRKNYMFGGSHQGAKYAAVYYSFFATCKLNDIEPLHWLTDVYKRIEDHNIQELEELLPTKNYQFKYV